MEVFDVEGLLQHGSGPAGFHFYAFLDARIACYEDDSVGQCGHVLAAEAVDLQAGTVRHVFTHFELRLIVYMARTGEADGEGWWSTPDAIGGEALPTVMKKAIATAIER